MNNVWKKIVLGLSCCFFLSCLFIVPSKANTIEKIGEVKQGEIVTTQLILTPNTKDRIHAFQGKLEYDQKIFQKVKSSDFQLMNGWEQFIYNENTQEFVLIHKKGSMDKQIVLNVNLRVKADSKVGETTVTFRNLVYSEGQKANVQEDEKRQVEIVENINKPQTNLPNNLQNGGANTGVQDNTMLYVVFALVSSVVLVFVWKKKNIWRKKNLKFLWIFAVLMSALITSTFQVSANGKQGDINGDGKITDTDIRLLSQHLVKTALLNSAQEKIANMNDDKNLDVVDLAILVTYAETEETPSQPEQENVSVDLVKKEFTLKKEETVAIEFALKGTSKLAKEITVNGRTYPLTKLSNGNYTFSYQGESAAKKYELPITQITFDDQTVKKVSTNISVTILKDMPEVETFTYDINEKDEVMVTIHILDADSALKNAKLSVFDKENKKVFGDADLTKGEQTINLGSALTKNNSYMAKIYASYDLDSSAGQNEANNQLLKELNINLTGQAVQLKDVESVTLYKQNGSTVEEVTSFNANETDLSKYFVKVNMRSMPSLYSDIKEVKKEGNKVKFVLKANDVITYDKEGKPSKEAEVVFGNLQGNTASSNTLEGFLAQIKANPNATITLENDLDFSAFQSNEAAVIMNEFTGTLDGNGYTLRNLNHPLFNQLKGATVKNLNIENVFIRAGKATNRWAVIANTADGSTIENVHLDQVKIQYTEDNNRGTGAIAGLFRTGKIERTSVSNLSMVIDQGAGGFVGQLNSSTISNSFIQGNISGKHDGVGGFAGVVEVTNNQNSTIENCYADIVLTVNNWKPHGFGGIVGKGKTGQLKVLNTISLAQRGQSQYNGYRFHGTNIGKESKNNYELNDSGLESNAWDSVKAIDKNAVFENSFFQTTMKWDSKIWDFSLTSQGKLPVLINKEKKVVSSILPEFDSLAKQNGYDAKNTIAYYNAYQLMPYYTVARIVENGNILANKEPFNTKKIKAIYAFDTKNQVVRHLTYNERANVAKIRIYFDDNSMSEHSVKVDNQRVYQVANYRVTDLNVDYNFHSLYVNKDLPIYKDLLNKAKSYVFNNGAKSNNLATLTKEDDDRLLIDHYNTVVNPNLDTILFDILSFNPAFVVSEDCTKSGELIKKELIEKEWLPKLLFGYNYVDRWYNINFNGISGRDIVFFDGSLLDNNPYWTPLSITSGILEASSRNSKEVVNVYNNVIAKYTKKSDLPQFIESLSKDIAKFEDTNEYFKKTFKGLVYEGKPDDKYLDYQYKVWDIVKRRHNFILPMLTMPSEDMYIVSTVGHLYVGSMNIYNEYKLQPGETDHTQARERMLSKMEYLGSRFAKYYSSLLNLVSKPEIMRTYAGTQFDSRFFSYANEGNKLNINTTQEPVLKNFYYAIGRDITDMQASAYAEGYDVAWIYPCLNDYATATHESIHNEEGNFIFGGYGRRDGTGAEWYTDSVMAQSFGGDKTVFNFSEEFDYEQEVGTNLTTERVNSPENIQSYYGNMWQALYFLDYIEGQALLKLKPEEQALMIQQVYWGDLGATQKSPTDDIGCSDKDYRRRNLTKEELTTMKLSSIEDLYDYRIVMNLNNNGNYQSIYHTYWYIPHYNQKVGHSWAYYTMSKELLGYKGWENGFVGYASGKYKNDLDALKGITGFDSFKKYKMARFDEVKQNMSKQPYFDEKELIDAFVEAFRMDAKQGVTNNGTSKNLRKAIYHNLKRSTNDFRSSIYDVKKVTVNSADELKKAIEKDPTAYIVLGKDIDMSALSTDKDVYFDVTFAGVIDGNNKKLTNVKKTLFTKLRFGNVHNLTIENPQYAENTKGAIANKMEISVLDGVIIKKPSPEKVTFATEQWGTFLIGGSVVERQEITE